MQAEKRRVKKKRCPTRSANRHRSRRLVSWTAKHRPVSGGKRRRAKQAMPLQGSHHLLRRRCCQPLLAGCPPPASTRRAVFLAVRTTSPCRCRCNDTGRHTNLAGPRLERLPDMAYAARRSPSCPASGPWCRGLAARLAVPRIADPCRTLSRLRASAFLAAQLARTAPLLGSAACRSVAHRCAVRPGNQHPATSHANCVEATPSPAPASLPQPLRPQPWMWWSHGPSRRPCPSLLADGLVGQTCESG